MPCFAGHSFFMAIMLIKPILHMRPPSGSLVKSFTLCYKHVTLIRVMPSRLKN